MRTLIALDLDGTLARLRRDPRAVRVPARRLRLLRRLDSATGRRVLIVSGRPLSFLRRVFSGTRAALSGDHGWELSGIGRPWRHPRLERRRAQARALAARLSSLPSSWPGTRVELKTASVAVHYRTSRRGTRDPLGLRRELKPFVPRGWRLDAGKRVWEFRPADAWGKGQVIRLAARRLRARVFFAGDDITDEQAFRELGRGARTVKVGRGATCAQRRVQGIQALEALLRKERF